MRFAPVETVDFEAFYLRTLMQEIIPSGRRLRRRLPVFLDSQGHLPPPDEGHCGAVAAEGKKPLNKRFFVMYQRRLEKEDCLFKPQEFYVREGKGDIKNL